MIFFIKNGILNIILEKINEIGRKMVRGANLMTLIHATEKGVDKILADIAFVLPVIQKIRGVWTAIYSDLDNLQNNIIYSFMKK